MSYYQTLSSMPCRKPFNRYTSVDDVYEGAVPVILEARMGSNVERYEYEPTVESFEGAYEPSVSRESYEYEPTVESFDKKNKNNGQRQNNIIIQRKQDQKQVNVAQNREKKINTVQACNCQCQPHFYVKEQYSDPMESDNCDCGPNHRAYRMHQCGYNQSPSWESHSVNSVPSQMMMVKENVRENMQPGMEKSCSCEMTPYYNEQCGDYNRSQTWADQRMFRENVLNKY